MLAAHGRIAARALSSDARLAASVSAVSAGRFDAALRRPAALPQIILGHAPPLIPIQDVNHPYFLQLGGRKLTQRQVQDGAAATGRHTAENGARRLGRYI